MGAGTGVGVGVCAVVVIGIGTGAETVARLEVGIGTGVIAGTVGLKTAGVIIVIGWTLARVRTSVHMGVR
jgi:hypothetical protein